MRFLIIFLFLTPMLLMGQSKYHKIDSLNILLVESSTDSLKVEVYRELGWYYRFINNDTSLYYSRASFDLAHKNKWPEKKARAILNMGYLEWERGDISNSEKYFTDALHIGKEIKDTFLLSDIVNALGLMNWKLGRNGEYFHHRHTCQNCP